MTLPADLQLSWYRGEMLAWRPDRDGDQRRGAYGTAPGMSRVMRADLPHGSRQVVAQRHSGEGLAFVGFRIGHDAPSASVRWFAELHRYATGLVGTGRLIPELTRTDSGLWTTRWCALAADLDAAAPLLEAMPPVVETFGPVHPAEVLESMVDALARATLGFGGFRADVARGAKALRLVSKALSGPEHSFVAEDEQVVFDLDDIALALHHARQRADGVPVLGARLRMLLPQPVSDHRAEMPGLDDAGTADGGRKDGDAASGDTANGDTANDETPGNDPHLDDSVWPLTLEVVDLDDRSKWCTAADVEAMTTAAHSVAGHPRHEAVLRDTVNVARQSLLARVPTLAHWQTSGATTISIEVAAEVLAAADSLTAAGVALVVPEGLTRRRPSARATAQPTSGSNGRFGAQAIVSWEATIDGDDVDEDALARIAAGGSNLLQSGGRWVQIDRRDAQRALQALQLHRRDHAELSPLELLHLAAELHATAEQAESGPPGDSLGIDAAGWAADLLAGMPDENIAEGVEPPGFLATLRPYQRRGLGWLQFLRRLGLGGCLADDMGLGKTPTTLAHLAGTPGPHLVVCPLSVVRNWQSETARFAPELRVLVHHGGGRHGADTLAGAVGDHDMVITTYQVATRDIAHLAEQQWSTVVLDEAQAVKNADTHTARAIRKLRGDQRIALTGTPVENRLLELWSILHTVTPGLLGGQAEFRRTYATPIERNHDQEAAERLRALTAPFLLRRTKADKSLVPDLPDKIEQIAWASLTPEQAHLYQQVVDQLLDDAEQAQGMRRRGLVLAALTRLKQICNHPAHVLADGSRLAGRSGKLNRFDELVVDLLDAGERALVFTQYREMGLLLQRHLHEHHHLQAPFLHGGVPKAGRDRMVDRFQVGAGDPLLLVSLKAGGTGLNLTAASRVVHYDRWWNPAVEDQATDRAWRIGQQRSVFVHKLVCQGTVEEKVDGLINDKRALAEAVIGTTGEAWLSELSTDELRDLVTLDRTMQ